MRHALILAGGSGTRLWPLSRDALPKQLIPMPGGRSLLEVAFARLEGLLPPECRHICGAEGFRAAVLSALPSLPPANYIGETEGRDTLPALALSMALVAARDPGALVAVLTSDHVIRPEADFRALLDRGFGLVEETKDTIVTFGVRPDRPATGFGWLELGGLASVDAASVDAAPGNAASPEAARTVLRFREKPALAQAQEFLSAGPGRFLWNSGMFIARASHFMALVEALEPDLAATVRELVAAGRGLPALMARLWPGVKKVSVDYGILEKASSVEGTGILALPLSIEWRDVGSWPAYGELLASDAEGNRSAGSEALFSGSRDCLVVGDRGLVALLGCEGLVVVRSGDVVMVCPRERVEEVKALRNLAAGLGEGRYV